MLPEPCNSARVRDGTVLASSNCVSVGCSSERPSVASSGVRCTRGRVAAATHGWAWPSFGWRVSPAARWPMGRVCG